MSEHKVCGNCKSEIKESAIICPYCNSVYKQGVSSLTVIIWVALTFIQTLRIYNILTFENSWFADWFADPDYLFGNYNSTGGSFIAEIAILVGLYLITFASIILSYQVKWRHPNIDD